MKKTCHALLLLLTFCFAGLQTALSQTGKEIDQVRKALQIQQDA